MINPPRDPAAAAQRLVDKDAAKARKKLERELRSAYREVFGYRPQLGEPERFLVPGRYGADRYRTGYYVHGFVFGMLGGNLMVLRDDKSWSVIETPGEFMDLYNRGVVYFDAS
ncbi:MAG: hypothetical protein LC650_00790 [Actinobacteria bacterium]|nr:hypothetical protein [Actinomycetota bacterium]